MRHVRQLRLAAFATVSALGCNPIHVKTATAPDANFTAAHTFRFLHWHASAEPVSNPAQSNDPMFESSITGQDVRRDISRDLAAKGYEHVQGGDDAMSDLSVAYYIGSRRKLQVTNYDYGYPFWGWGWRWGPGWGAWPAQQITSYNQGTVIIDVLDSTGHKLLWRGEGRSEVPSNPDDYQKALAKTVAKILSTFPSRSAE
jgi:Domain of unknown function (DUF4136)